MNSNDEIGLGRCEFQATQGPKYWPGNVVLVRPGRCVVENQSGVLRIVECNHIRQPPEPACECAELQEKLAEMTRQRDQLTDSLGHEIDRYDRLQKHRDSLSKQLAERIARFAGVRICLAMAQEKLTGAQEKLTGAPVSARKGLR